MESKQNDREHDNNRFDPLEPNFCYKLKHVAQCRNRWNRCTDYLSGTFLLAKINPGQQQSKEDRNKGPEINSRFKSPVSNSLWNSGAIGEKCTGYGDSGATSFQNGLMEEVVCVYSHLQSQI